MRNVFVQWVRAKSTRPVPSAQRQTSSGPVSRKCPGGSAARYQALLCLLAWTLPSLVAAAATPPDLAVHNSRFVYSSEEKTGGFNLAAYLAAEAPWLQPYRELITHWSAYSTVSPRITLALIETQTGLVSTETPSSGDLRRPFGNLSSNNTFDGQTDDVLRRLARSFYANSGTSDLLRQPTAASQALRSLLGTEAQLVEFHRSFQRIFPSLAPLAQGRSNLTDPKTTSPPASLLQLPFPTGDAWFFNGAHTQFGQDPGPKSSIDFSRDWTSWGANTSGNWVVAATSGTVVVHSRCFVEIIATGGWSTSYYQLDNVVVNDGAFVRQDQRLGNYASSQRQALCRGDASGPHVHFSLLRKGELVSIHDALLSAYRVDVGRSSYDQDCQHFWLERGGVRHCAGVPLTNQSSNVPPPTAPAGLEISAVSHDEVTLQWQDLSNNESAFEIERRSTGDFERLATVGANLTQFRSLGLDSATSYEYRVRAVNVSGGSAYSNIAMTMTSGERPPYGLTALTLSAEAIELRWVDNAILEERYEIEGRSNAAEFAVLRTVSADSESVVIDGLTPQTSYTFRVRASGSRGASTYTDEVTATTFAEDPGPCLSDDTTLCLNQGRFRVEVDWLGFDGVHGDATRVSQGTDDSGLFWFFRDQNWEMLVKVLDGCGVNQRFWVFAAATTNVEYTLRVTDTSSGIVKTYFNPLGVSAPAITDSAAFATCGADPGVGADPAELSALTSAGGLEATAASARLAGNFTKPMSLKTGDTTPCVEGSERLCLNGGRFEISVSWEDFNGSSGAGRTAPLRSDDSGLFWFFDGDNWEMLAKIVDGCSVNSHYWFFAASTTNLGFRLSVRDTHTGTVRQYDNAVGRAAEAITDIEALAVCP